ncbi:MAG: ABC transporter permease [Anaerolineae bacterium]
MSTSARPLDTVPDDAFAGDLRTTLSNALIITRREVRDSFRDWRIIGPIIVLTFLFPGLAQFVAAQFASFVEGYGAAVIGTRTVPFLLMIVGFFPISISLVIALETFVGEKERRSLEPLLSTPLTNTELYIGKTLAAMLPPLLSSYGGMAVYLISLIFGDLAWRPHAILVVQIILLTTVQALAMVTGGGGREQPDDQHARRQPARQLHHHPDDHPHPSRERHHVPRAGRRIARRYRVAVGDHHRDAGRRDSAATRRQQPVQPRRTAGAHARQAQPEGHGGQNLARRALRRRP